MKMYSRYGDIDQQWQHTASSASPGQLQLQQQQTASIRSESRRLMLMRFKICLWKIDAVAKSVFLRHRLRRQVAVARTGLRPLSLTFALSRCCCCLVAWASNDFVLPCHSLRCWTVPTPWLRLSCCWDDISSAAIWKMLIHLTTTTTTEQVRML